MTIQLQSVINWTLLILGGLTEVGFTFCLGKLRNASSQDYVSYGESSLKIAGQNPARPGVGIVGPVVAGLKTLE